MKNLVPLGRIIYAIPFAFFGLMHFVFGDSMKGVVPDFMPGDAIVWVYLTGVALILASVSILINKKSKLAAILLAVMLLVFILTIHLPLAVKEDTEAMTRLFKDLALMGAALTYAGSGKS